MKNEDLQVETSTTLQQVVEATERKVKAELERIEIEKKKEREVCNLRIAQEEHNRLLNEIKSGIKLISHEIQDLGGSRVNETLSILVKLNEIILQFLLQEYKLKGKDEDELNKLMLLLKSQQHSTPSIKIIGNVASENDVNIKS